MDDMTGQERNKLKKSIVDNLPFDDHGKREIILHIINSIMTDAQLLDLALYVKNRR